MIYMYNISECYMAITLMNPLGLLFDFSFYMYFVMETLYIPIFIFVHMKWDCGILWIAFFFAWRINNKKYIYIWYLCIYRTFNHYSLVAIFFIIIQRIIGILYKTHLREDSNTCRIDNISSAYIILYLTHSSSAMPMTDELSLVIIYNGQNI